MEKTRGFIRVGPVVGDLGIVGLMGIVGEGLKPYYGTGLPLGGMVFIRLWPTELTMARGNH